MGSVMLNENAMQKLLDKEEIREVIGVRYARGMDWYDLNLLKGCFHSDSEIDYGYFKGNAHEWCEKRVVERNPAELHRFHYCFPAQIEVSGDTAMAESTSYAGFRTRENESEKYVFFGARYSDTLKRREGVWRITRRVVHIDFTYDAASSGQAEGLQKGLPFLKNPSPSHPAYMHFGSGR